VESYYDIKLPQSSKLEGQEMRRNLITSGSYSAVSGEFSGYGAISFYNDEPPMSNLKEAQEDRANILSRLFFYWVNPLMIKGSLGRLQKPEDLPPLPKSLNTEEIRNKFHRILFGTVRETNPSHLSVKMTIPQIQDSSYHVFSESGTQDTTSTHKQQDDDDDRYSLYSNMSALQLNSTGRPTTLFLALNKAFGLHYYSLGIVKLLNDLLGFAGPLLLHALVSYMENNNVSSPFCHGKLFFVLIFRNQSLTGIIMPVVYS